MNYTFQFGEVWRYWTWLANGVGVTLAFTFVATFLSIALGTIVAVGRNSRYGWLRAVCRLYVEIIRNTPFLVQLFILFFGLPSAGIRMSASVAAMIGLVVYNGAFMTEIVRAGLQAIHRSQIEAGLSIGMSRLQIFIYVIFKPALEKVYPALSSQIILLMLSTSVISAIGVDELTSFAGHIQTLNFRSIEVYLVAIVIYLALTLVLRQLARLLGYVIFPHRRDTSTIGVGA